MDVKEECGGNVDICLLSDWTECWLYDYYSWDCDKWLIVEWWEGCRESE